MLRRTADDDDPVERVIVANADQLVVVAALADPEPRPRLIDRALVAAYDAGLEPLLCLTKADLADPETLLAIYRPLGVPLRRDTRRGERPRRRSASGCTARSACWSGTAASASPRWSTRWCPAATGPSGTSTRSPAAGRHTSTSALMLALPPLPDGGWIVDTPGIRSFGLAHVQPGQLIGAFPDLEELTDSCPRGCTHGEGEPECGLDEAVADGPHGRRAGRLVPAAARQPRAPPRLTSRPARWSRRDTARGPRTSDRSDRQHLSPRSPRDRRTPCSPGPRTRAVVPSPLAALLAIARSAPGWRW